MVVMAGKFGGVSTKTTSFTGGKVRGIEVGGSLAEE